MKCTIEGRTAYVWIDDCREESHRAVFHNDKVDIVIVTVGDSKERTTYVRQLEMGSYVVMDAVTFQPVLRRGRKWLSNFSGDGENMWFVSWIGEPAK